MDPIRLLRDRAAEKRDKAIAVAKTIYRKDIASIDALERTLPIQAGELDFDRVPSEVNVYELMAHLIPKDKPFTVSEMMEWLNASHPNRKFRENTVRTYVSRLCRRGEIRKLYKTSTNYTLWIAISSDMTEPPIEARTLADMADEILFEAGRPLKATEIAVAMQERGYRPDAQPVTLMRGVRDMFKRNRKRFKRDSEGRWSAA